MESSKRIKSMNSDFDAWFDDWSDKVSLEANFGKWSIAAIANKAFLQRNIKPAMKIAWLAAKESK